MNTAHLLATRVPRSPRSARLSVLTAILSLSICGFAGACDDGDDGDGDDDGAGDGAEAGDGDGDVSFDEAPVQAALAAFPDGFTQVNATPFETQGHQQAFDVNVWVQSAGAAAYGAVDPDSTGAMPDIGEGLIIVKEQFDDSAAVAGYTVMTKAAPGFDPDGGDWWWGFANADGELTNTSLDGDVGFCVSCHAARPDDDWLYGVATDNRP